MHILDRYLTKRFLTFFFFAILASLAVYLIVDPIENLDKFLDKNIPWSEIGRYYLLYIPFIVYQTYPVAMLLGTMFCIGGLTTKNELMAMTASGIPLMRHLLLLTSLALLLSSFMFWWGETIVPEMNRERLAIWRQQVKGGEDWQLTDQGQVYLQDRPGRVLHLDLYQPTTETGYGVDLYEFVSGEIKLRINARSMSWKKNHWELFKVVVRKFGPDGENVTRMENRDIELNVIPSDMVELQVEPEEMSMEQLIRFAERIESTGGTATRWRVDIYSKVALPFAGVIIVLFGVPISAVRRRSGVIFGIMISLLISFIFFGIMQMGKVLGYREMMDPWIASWMGNILFFFIGIFLYWRTPR
ncbi:MAG TPA: LPS export ABC transporter permease LptG [Bacteroidetes bacterium]|nr:lipopolysaccharide export system permease protein LptG [bacterium BMS3Bbin04]HDO64978.1 LPS export ABC transporter permease LptG [Bacteroidota bacterium]HEX04103.1 LPS export ABC transporter permease LptG [Bacteroidota bacterium]